MKKGFTIVEIVIVVVVIGILAGITVVGYGAWRERTAITAVKNDLLAASVVMKGTQDRQTGFSTALPSSFESSDGVTLSLKTGSTAKFYCLEATTTGKPGVTFFIDSGKNTEPTEGVCVIPYTPPSSPIPLSGGGCCGWGYAVSPTTDHAYYTTSNASGADIRKVSLSNGTSEVLISSPAIGPIRGMAFDSAGELYVAAETTIYKVNLTTKTYSSIISMPGDTIYSLYIDGTDTIYAGGIAKVYKYSIPTSSLTTLYSGSNAYFSGVVKLDNYLYLTRLQGKVSRLNLANNAMTIDYTNPPAVNRTGNMIELNGVLYLMVAESLYAFNTADSTWHTLVEDVRSPLCSFYPFAIGKKQNYIVFVSRPDPGQTTCATLVPLVINNVAPLAV